MVPTLAASNDTSMKSTDDILRGLNPRRVILEMAGKLPDVGSIVQVASSDLGTLYYGGLRSGMIGRFLGSDGKNVQIRHEKAQNGGRAGTYRMTLSDFFEYYVVIDNPGGMTPGLSAATDGQDRAIGGSR